MAENSYILKKIEEYIDSGDIKKAEQALLSNINRLKNNEEALTLYICFQIHNAECEKKCKYSIFDCVLNTKELIERYTIIKFRLRRLEFGIYADDEENFDEFIKNYRVSFEALKIITNYSVFNKDYILDIIKSLETGDCINCKEIKIEDKQIEDITKEQSKNIKDNEYKQLDNITAEDEIQEQKVCFIICTNNNLWLRECLLYIDNLNLPENITKEVLTIEGALSMTEGYNAAMSASDAKYKVYLHQDVFIVNKNFIVDMINVFNSNKDIKMIGMAGSKRLPESMAMWDNKQRAGALYCNNVVIANEYYFDIPINSSYELVQAVDGLLIATASDINWREDKFKGWDFYDVSQSMEFIKAGYKIAVPKQETPWCVHDDGILNLTSYKIWQMTARREYGAFLRELNLKNEELRLENKKQESEDKNKKSEKRNILFLDWGCYGKEDVAEAFIEIGYNPEPFILELKSYREDNKFTAALAQKLKEKKYEFVFSLNYYPAVSIGCMECQIPYICWIYDNPQVVLYSETIKNPCNFIFLFDSSQYEELKALGADTVYYMPLAVNAKRLLALKNKGLKDETYASDITFVGSIYNEKHNLYERMTEKLDKDTISELEEIIKKQQKIYGKFILEDLITDDLYKKMSEAMPYAKNKDALESDKYTYANYFLGRRLAQVERIQILDMLSRKYDVSLYTFNKPDNLDKVHFKGKTDYYKGMPYVFYNSKINLNISLRTIKTGIPLRAWDILGSGGFLMSNYQADLGKILIPGTDYAEYSSYEELMEKCEYFLVHEKERREIAENGSNKVIRGHSYKIRLLEILKIFKKCY